MKTETKKLRKCQMFDSCLDYPTHCVVNSRDVAIQRAVDKYLKTDADEGLDVQGLFADVQNSDEGFFYHLEFSTTSSHTDIAMVDRGFDNDLFLELYKTKKMPAALVEYIHMVLSALEECDFNCLEDSDCGWIVNCDDNDDYEDEE